MKTHYYYKALRKTIIQFCDIFNDIRIARYKNGVVQEYIDVPLKFMPKEKIYFWINAKDENGLPRKEIILPMIGIAINSVDYAEDRQTSKMEKIIHSIDGSTKRVSRYRNPAPYNVGFQVSIYGKSVVDVDQILEQILPYFTPRVVMRIYIPELDGYFEVPVIFEGATPEAAPEIDEGEYRTLRWDLTFQAQTYFFRPLNEDYLGTDGTGTGTDAGVPAVTKVAVNVYRNSLVFDNRSTSSTTSGASGAITYQTKSTDYDADGGYRTKLYKKKIDGTFEEYDRDSNGVYINDQGEPLDTKDTVYIKDSRGRYEVVITKDLFDKIIPTDNSAYLGDGLEYDDDGKLLVELERFGDE